ncbi:MAG: TolC family protein [Acidobacteriota bacterium]|nr:TolC family protein [Acidobacteriota bacterium]
MNRVIRTAIAYALLPSLSLQASGQTTQTVTPELSPAQTARSTNSQTMDVLTLEGATEQFLQRNISLEAARLEINIAEAERIGARFRPRPGLTVSAENLRVSGETPFNRLYEAGATIAQPLELGNRQGIRREVADRTVAVAEAQLTNVLRQRLFELKRAYYDAMLARAVLLIEQENQTNFTELVRFNTVRLNEGYIAEGELLKVRLEQIKFNSGVANAALRVRQANVRLLELLGVGDYGRAARLEVAGRMVFRSTSLDLAALRQAALANRAEVKVAEAQSSLTESVFRLERSRAKGEITPFVGYTRVGVDNTARVGVTVPLPFGNRNQGGIARAEAEQGVAAANLRLARNRALAEVEATYQAYETAREQVQAYETGILRQADESRDITLAAYREGATELIALLDAQRTRSEIRANYYRALFDYQTSIFQLELATGTEFKP